MHSEALKHATSGASLLAGAPTVGGLFITAGEAYLVSGANSGLSDHRNAGDRDQSYAVHPDDKPAELRLASHPLLAFSVAIASIERIGSGCGRSCTGGQRRDYGQQTNQAWARHDGLSMDFDDSHAAL